MFFVANAVLASLDRYTHCSRYEFVCVSNILIKIQLFTNHELAELFLGKPNLEARMSLAKTRISTNRNHFDGGCGCRSDLITAFSFDII